MTPTLQTARLALRPYVPADEESFVALFQDERVSRWMGDGPSPEAEDRALFWRVFGVYERQQFDVWAVCCDGEQIGHAEIKPTEVSGGHEIVYALAARAWGRGFGTELAAALVDYGFDVLDLPAVHATVAEDNVASFHLLVDKLGFVHVRDLDDDGEITRFLTRERPATARPAS